MMTNGGTPGAELRAASDLMALDRVKGGRGGSGSLCRPAEGDIAALLVVQSL